MRGLLWLAAALALWAPQDPLTGEWLTEAGDGRVQISREGARYRGTLTWLRDPAPDGGVWRDEQNPEPALRSRPLLGLTLLEELEKDADGYGGGSLYDPTTGKRYRGQARLRSADVLELRGYVGIPLFGRSERWTRVRGTDAGTR